MDQKAYSPPWENNLIHINVFLQSVDHDPGGDILIITLLQDSVTRKLSSISDTMRRNFGHGMASVNSPGGTHGRADTSNMPKTAF
jgi:hypothetical protein